jgi:hypothetical protein
MRLSGEAVAKNGSPAILLIPVLAVSFGIAAVLLSGGVGYGPAGTSVGSSGGGLLHAISGVEVGETVAILFGIWLLYRVIQRLRGESLSVPARFLVTGLVAISLALAFIVAVHLFVHAVASPGAGPGPLQPGQGGRGPNATSPQPANNSTLGVPSPIFPLPIGWPWWIPYVVLAGIGAAIGGLAVPLALARSRAAAPTRLGHPSPPVESALRSALSTLDGYQGDDPRLVIIALYGELLKAVGTRAGPIEPKTARELSRSLVEGLGVSASVSQELTDRFEEARYSLRPLDEAAVPRTRRALTQALEELHPKARSGP